MKKIDVVIAFSDSDYADALARYFAQYEKNLNIIVRKHDYRRIGKDEIIIRDYENDDEEKITGSDYRNSSAEKNNEREIRFDGFCDTETLVKEIRRIGGSRTYPKRAGNKNDMRIVFVTGSSGGAGASSVASALCTELKVYHGKKVLLLDFSPFPNPTGDPACRNVKELIYLLGCVKAENEGAGVYSHRMPSFENFVVTDYNGIDRLNYGEDVNYFSRAITDEIMGFFQYLFESGDFDYIVADISLLQLVRLHYDSRFAFSEIVDVLVSVSPCGKAAAREEKQDIPVTEEKGRKESVSALKGKTAVTTAEKYEDFINKIRDFNNDIRIISAENFCDADAFISDMENDKPGKAGEKVFIDYDADSFAGGIVRIDGSFGIAIKNIAHRLVF